MYIPKKYIFLIIILFIVGASYYYIYYNSPELFIKKIIDQSLKGQYETLPVNEFDKELLQDFFTNASSTNDIRYSIKALNNDNHYVVNIEKFEYNNKNELAKVVYGILFFQLDRSSILNYKITEIRILKDLQIDM